MTAPVAPSQPKINAVQQRALTFLLEPWEASWWAGKPHGHWPSALNARVYEKLLSDGLISWKGAKGSPFRRVVKITDAGRAALSTGNGEPGK